MVHLLLQALAERTTANGTLLLCVWERDLADTVTHAVLLHHRVGHTCHFTQVILSSWGQRSGDNEDQVTLQCLYLDVQHKFAL